MRARSILLVLLAALAAGPAPAASRKKVGWRRRVEAGINVTQGNKDTSRERVEVAVEGKGTNWLSDLSLEGVVGEADGEKNQEKLKAQAKYQRDLSRRVYASFTLEYLYDGIAEIDYRVVASPAVGVYAIREDTQSLRLEAGPALIAEKKAGEREVYPALRLAELYDCRLTKVSRLKQYVEYLPDLRGPEHYLLNAGLELESDMDENLSLGVKLESNYDSAPGEDNEKQDLAFSTSIKYRF